MLNKISASLLLLLLGRKEGRRPKAEQRRSLSLSYSSSYSNLFCATSRGIENTKVCFTREGDECVRAFGILKETRGRKEENSGEIKFFLLDFFLSIVRSFVRSSSSESNHKSLSFSLFLSL